MPSTKKFLFLLLIITLITGVFFYKEIKQAWQITIKKSALPLISENSISIPIDNSDPMYGNPGAPITVIEFGDIGCDQCKKDHYIIKNFVSKHPMDLRLVWKDAPRTNVFVSGYILAHQAAQCAGKQNKFWQFLEIAMQNTNNLQEPGLKKIAEGLNLDTAKWWMCVNASEIKQKIQASIDLADQLGINKLPAVFVNNKQINTDKDIDLEKLLEQIIKKPEEGPVNSDTNQSTQE